MCLAITKSLYVDKKKKKMIEKSHLKNTHYCYGKSHKIQRIHEILWRDENQGWTDYSSAFSAVFSQLFCSENKGNVCFILITSVGNASVLSYFYSKTLLPRQMHPPFTCSETTALKSNENVLSRFWANHGNIFCSLLFQTFPSVESESLLCYLDGKGQENI